MSFARPRNLPAGTIATSMQRHMDREIEQRCAAHKEEQLNTLKAAAAPKLHINDNSKHDNILAARKALHAAKLRDAEEHLRQAKAEADSRLQDVEARTNLALRLSVTERGNMLHEATSCKRHTEAARHAKNKRKLEKIVNGAKPRTEVALSEDVLKGLDALEKEKRSQHKAEQAGLKVANKLAGQRLRDAVRAHTKDNALAVHAAAHEQRLGEVEKLKAAKKLEEQRAAKAHRKQLSKLASAAKPKTVVSLSPEHEQKLKQLTQASEAKQKLHQEALREHEQKLSALAAGSQRKIIVAPVDATAPVSARPRVAAERFAATVIQAARRGSVGRSEASVVRRALARRQAVASVSESKLAAKLQGAVALAQSRHVQRRNAITPAERRVMNEAAATVAAAA